MLILDKTKCLPCVVENARYFQIFVIFRRQKWKSSETASCLGEQKALRGRAAVPNGRVRVLFALVVEQHADLKGAQRGRGAEPSSINKKMIGMIILFTNSEKK